MPGNSDSWIEGTEGQRPGGGNTLVCRGGARRSVVAARRMSKGASRGVQGGDERQKGGGRQIT